MSTKQKVREFLEKFVNQCKLTDEDNIFEMGLINSLFAMQLVNFLENEFDISLSNEELDLNHFKNINSISNLVEAKIA